MSERSSQLQLATRRLRDDILRGVLVPGSSISEAAVAARYGTGLASARSALQRLSAVGLVEARPRRGHVISQVRVRDVREVYELRLALEPLAASLATGRVDAAELRRREEAALAARQGHAADPAAAILHNRWFHGTIARAAGNRRLARQLDELHGEMERFAMIGLALGRRAGSVLDQHLPIVEALAAGQPEAAATAARAHVETAMRDVIDVIVGREGVLDRPIAELAS
ncbi:MAG: GntR family transcriptional regulator [Rhodobacteraceae bacterium]|nr:GntR family transcriptional regulator [Paracoccaceae bacterium]